MLNLYKNIKIERLRNGWNQSELAKRVGYTDKSMIAKIEAGKVDLSQTKIRAFANVFGVTESYLMGWDEAEFDVSSIENTLTKSELNLIKQYRAADDSVKDMIVKLLAYAVSKED